MNVLNSILAASALAFTANTAVADEHGHWIADFDVAVEMAKTQNKDLLVDFTGSDWCGWCIKLHEEVFDHDAFLKPAMEKYILVALDFPQDEAIKALVPNPERNAELQEKYAIQGFPTILLMNANGEVFGRTGYRPDGPESYIAHMAELASKGKPAIAAAKQLIAELKGSDEMGRVAVLEKVIAKVQELGPDSAPAAILIPTVKMAIEKDADNAKGLKLKGIKALLMAQAADEAHLSAAREFDPKNEKGLYELAVIAQFSMVRTDVMALAAVDALKGLQNPKDKAEVAMLFGTAARWSAGPLKDLPAAKQFAQKAIDMGLSDERLLGALEGILAQE